MSAATERLLDQIDVLRKENDAMRGSVAYLVGYYGEKARTSGNEGLAAMAGELHAVLDGTWSRPGSGQ